MNFSLRQLNFKALISAKDKVAQCILLQLLISHTITHVYARRRNGSIQFTVYVSDSAVRRSVLSVVIQGSWKVYQSVAGQLFLCCYQGGNYRGGSGGSTPSSLCQPPTNIFSILLGVNRNPQFSQYEIGFPQQLKKLTAVLWQDSILSLSRVSQCIMINYNQLIPNERKYW